ncbi:MAG: N2,N2-dimethylguanosine tRNA methyltransferase [Prochlorococcus sp.]|nr:N2,N2-dimethylguanosine tRNA methyltransferase [Prochlorococcaceae cyanobacterium ETNP18_MAG_1]
MDVHVGSLEVSCIQGGLIQPNSHYREGSATLELGDGFFRADSRPSRDLSVLLAALQYQSSAHATSPLRWLDLMAGCGIRSLRWGLESVLSSATHSAGLLPPEIWVNDADPDRAELLNRNLEPLRLKGGSIQLANEPAEALLSRAHYEGRCFDLIDLDGFGCPNALLQPVLNVLANEGVLLLASSDGRSPTGHDRCGAIRRLAAAARTHPASWEVALRLQMAALARHAWVLGRGLEPLACFSDGRTFRLAVRLKSRLAEEEEHLLGLLARCDACGDQAIQPLLSLQGWPSCHCSPGDGRWAVSGPLWLGRLQSVEVLGALLQLEEQLPLTMSPVSFRLLQRLKADVGLPVCCWSINELAKRLALSGPPPVSALVEALRSAGHQAYGSALMAGQVRSDVPFAELLRVCQSIHRAGR